MSPATATDAGDRLAPAALEAVEAALRQVRVLAAAVLFLQFARQPAGTADLPFGLSPQAVAVVLALLLGGVNLLSLRGQRATGRRAVVLGAAELAADAALVFLVVTVLGVGREDLMWVAFVIPVLEGALRYRLPGAVATWALLSCAYLAAQLSGVGDATLDEELFLGTLATAVQRLAVILLVAVPAGYLSGQLLVDIDTQRRATRDAVRRSLLLQRVAEAGERVTQLDEEVLQAVLDCATALGFPDASVWEPRAGGGRVAAAAGRDAGTLPSPAALRAATDLAVRQRATVVVEPADADPAELRVLADHDRAAVVLTPLVRRDDVALLLMAGVREGPLAAPQIESLELLAGQAGTALRNGLLVTELRAAQAQLEHLAFTDGLTSLANRALFLLRLQDTLARRTAEGGRGAVLFLDLDRFKPVNDTLGHDVGDELLRDVAGRLVQAVRAGDLVARLGGDEFVVLMDRTADDAEPDQVAERIVAALSAPFTPSGHEVVISTSVGIAAVDGTLESAAETLRRADVAMYSAKAAGQGRWRHWSVELDAEVRERVSLEADLRHALERDELGLVYQPIVRLADGAIEGFEALLRWHHPRLGLLGPERFLPVAEESGLIDELGRWVLDRAAEQLRGLQADLPVAPFVSVNVSPRQLRHPGFLAILDTVVADAGVDPNGLLLEISERVVAFDDCEQLLHELRRRGLRLALDDFGTGQTSLRYLRRFPLDVLKVDKSIVSGAAGDRRDRVVFEAILGLASALGLALVAEGVEDEPQARLLRELGCRLGQGFHLDRPVDGAEVPALARDRAPAASLAGSR